MLHRKSAGRVLRRVGARHVAVILSACGGAVAALAGASCSLGLDESLIDKQQEAAAVDAPAGDSSSADGGDGAPPPINPEAGVCAKDSDCKGTMGCLTAKCDVPRKACVLQVCRQTACNSATCDVPMAKCGAAKPYKYRANQFAVGAGVGCGGQLGRCFAAVYPFVFVGTTNGVIAFAGNDPQNPAPAAVALTGLGFVPNQIVASGSRVYFLGTPVGAGVNSRVPLAYADVPPNPFATKIDVTTVLPSYNRASTDALLLFPRGNDTALLVDTNVATAFASTAIEPPLLEPLSLGSNGIASTAGAAPLATTGTRLVMGQIVAATAAPVFGLVANAGSSAPLTVADVPIATATPAAAPQFFSQSADGAVFWAYTALVAAPPAAAAIRAAKGYFLVADGTAPTFDPAAGIDLELYPTNPALGSVPSVGPVAMLDAKTALVTTSSPANPLMVTNVSFVTRSPAPAFVKNADMMKRQFQITLAATQLAAAGSNGLGYVLAVDPAAPLAPVVYVFDPACAP